jgi:hypothetical protein
MIASGCLNFRCYAFRFEKVRARQELCCYMFLNKTALKAFL